MVWNFYLLNLIAILILRIHKFIATKWMHYYLPGWSMVSVFSNCISSILQNLIVQK